MRERPAGRRPLRFVSRFAIVMLAIATTGCGYTQGQALYFLGVGQGRMIDAEFELDQEGPIMVLVDDFEELLDSPRIQSELGKRVGDELTRNKAAAAVISQAEVRRLRQENTDFDQRGCREVGRMAGAHQVVWLQLRDYFASSAVEEIKGAARMAVTVKVINALEEEDADAVRLWPPDPNGRLVGVDIDAAEALRSEDSQALPNQLSDLAAAEVAKLFYRHNIDEDW